MNAEYGDKLQQNVRTQAGQDHRLDDSDQFFDTGVAPRAVVIETTEIEDQYLCEKHQGNR